MTSPIEEGTQMHEEIAKTPIARRPRTDAEINLMRLEGDLRCMEFIDKALGDIRFSAVGHVKYPYADRYLAIHANIRAQVLGMMAFLDADIAAWKEYVAEDVTEEGPRFHKDVI